MEEKPSLSGDDHPTFAQIQEFAAGRIHDPSLLDFMEAHIADCGACADLMASFPLDEMERKLARLGNSLVSDGKHDRYELLEEIGRGGIGVIYRARDAELGREVAVKLLLTGARASPAELARFRREAKVLAQLDHPAIVRIHDSGEQAGTPFLAMEYVTGPALSTRLKRGPLDPRVAAEWTRVLARAIEFAHSRSVVHRDLKPQNVLLAPTNDSCDGLESNQKPQLDSKEKVESAADRNFRPRLIDFGLASFGVQSDFRTRTGETLGTPAYLAPEMIEAGDNSRQNPAADIYGLGTILYESLIGLPPFSGNHAEVISAVRDRDPPQLRTLRPSIPRDLATICHRCLAKQPEKRFSSAGELANELDRFLEGKPIHSRPASAIEKSWRWVRRNPWKSATAALVALVLVSIPLLLLAANFRLQMQEREAHQRYIMARQTVWKMLDSLESDDAARLSQVASLLYRQSEAALEMFRELANAENTADARLDLVKSLIRSGTVAAVLGKQDVAVHLLTESGDICRQLVSEHPESHDYRRWLATALNKRGAICPRGEYEVADRYVQEAASIYRQLTKDRPNDRAYTQGLAWTLHLLATNRQYAKDRPQAIEFYEECLALHDELAKEDGNSMELRRSAAETHVNLATTLLEEGDSARSALHFQQAIADLEWLLPRESNQVNVIESLSAALLNYSNLLGSDGKSAEAIASCARARSLLLTALEKEPDRLTLRNNLFLTTANMANFRGSSGQLDVAAESYELASEVAPDESSNVYCRQLRVRCLVLGGNIAKGVLELDSIDVAPLNVEDKFRQADCWGVVANKISETSDNPTETTREGAVERAIAILETLRESNQLTEIQRQHLREDSDWNSVRFLVAADRWMQLTKQ